MVAFRNLALSLIPVAGHANGAAARRFYAARPEKGIQLINPHCNPINPTRITE